MAETVQMEGNVTGSEAPVPEVNEDRPEWLPEKFKSGEELSKAYGELEKQFTQSRQEASTSDAEQPEQEDQSDARQAVENAGLDFDAMNNEFAETGQLSEKTYADLEAKGIPKEMVDSYIEGQQAISVSYQNELYGQAGGEDNYNQMSEWAAENMNESEIDAYKQDSLLMGCSLVIEQVVMQSQT